MWFRPMGQTVIVKPLALRATWLAWQEPDVGVNASQTPGESCSHLWMSASATQRTVRVRCPFLNLKGLKQIHICYRREKRVQLRWNTIWWLVRLKFHTLQPSHDTSRCTSSRCTDTQDKFLRIRARRQAYNCSRQPVLLAGEWTHCSKRSYYT